MPVQGLSEDAALINALHQSPFTFHLTGSRFFGFPRHDSDWDFYVQDSEEVRAFLRNLGFYAISDTESPYVGDPNTAYVMHKGDIDVQLQKDATLKGCVQEAIRTSNLLLRLSRLDQKRLWKAMYDLASSLDESGRWSI